MADARKTNLYLNAADRRRLKAIARPRRARSVAAAASRRGDLSERAEELLAGLKRR